MFTTVLTFPKWSLTNQRSVLVYVEPDFVKVIRPSSQAALSKVSLPLAGTEYTKEPMYLSPDPSDLMADTLVPSDRQVYVNEPEAPEVTS